MWHLSAVPTTIYEVKNLDSLIELDLYRSIIGTNALVHLLQKTINLKTLDLVDCRIDSEENDKVLNLGALEKLNLNGASISTSLTTKLLKNARNLKVLRLGFWNYDDEEIDEELNLELLETLDFESFSTISTSSAQKIIKNAKNLKRFSLIDCPRVSDKVFETLNPDSLEKLRLKCSLNKNFFQFLKNTRNLKKLYVTEGDFLVENLGTLNLASLKILTIMQSRMSSSSLGQFLKQARSLKIINLSKCVIVYPEPSEPLDLQLLEQLELNHSNILNSQEN